MKLCYSRYRSLRDVAFARKPRAAQIDIYRFNVITEQPLLLLMSNELTVVVTTDIGGSALFFNASLSTKRR